ncbi:hypothetical protein NC651_029305 [Populus alba x Populus x berolinensis]|nr:hypothetical protein NC651_029305 [Populus alba x Populus x berolinensis]
MHRFCWILLLETKQRKIDDPPNSGGPSWNVLTGRKDGRDSHITDLLLKLARLQNFKINKMDC